LIIPVTGLAEEGKWFEGEAAGGLLGLESESESLRPDGPLRYRLHAALTCGRLVVAGSVGARVAFRCARCAEFFALQVEDSGFNCVCQVPPGSESVDLTPDVREAILLAFPNFPVCSEDCKGLCPRCGADLNKGKCNCRPPPDGLQRGIEGLGGLTFE
jgi:uncharacterized protein